MSETACCAHLHVSYQTVTLPNVGTHGWWACDDCNKRFAPISNTASDGESVRPVDATRGKIDFAGWWEHYLPQARCSELVPPSVYIGGNHGAYSPSGIEIPRPEEEVRKEVLAECGYTDDGPIAPTYGFYIPWVKDPERYGYDAQPEEPAPVSWWSRVWRRFR